MDALKMMKIFLPIFLFLFLFAAAPAVAQDNSANTKADKKNEVINARLKRKKAKTEWKAKRKKEKSERKAIRLHEKRLQTKETRKRLKKDRAKSQRINQNKKQFFLIRLFKPKPRTGVW